MIDGGGDIFISEIRWEGRIKVVRREILPSTRLASTFRQLSVRMKDQTGDICRFYLVQFVTKIQRLPFPSSDPFRFADSFTT